MREFSIPQLSAIPADASLADVVYHRAANTPDAAVMRRLHDGTWQEVTAAAFRDEVTALARGIVAQGIGPGDRVGLMSRTRYEWTLIDYAVLAAGAVTVPIYETSSAEQAEWILADSGASAVFAETTAHAQIISAARERAQNLHHIWTIDAISELSASTDAVTDTELDARRAARGADDMATIIYTSGTTGQPKGCQLTHRNLLADVRNAAAALPELFSVPGGSTLLFLPLAHSFARIIQIGCLETGTVLGHWPDIATVAEGLRGFRPTFLLAVPRVFEKVFNTAQQQASVSRVKNAIFQGAARTAIELGAATPGTRPAPALALRHVVFDRLVYRKLRAALGGQVNFAVSGGAPLSERLGHFFRGAGITVLEGYGLTETSAAATVNRPARNKIGTVGLPVPGVSVRIADDGEILLRGPNVFPGYWRNRDASAEVLDDDGWLRTGDVGKLDEEGFLQVTGRLKELIVTASGKNVSPSVLEDRLRAHPLVGECMVVGDERPYIGCLITVDTESLEQWKRQHSKAASATVAELAGDPDLLADLQQAVDEANGAVSRAESIRRFRVISGAFTESGGQLTPSLKIRRPVVTQMYAAEIDALYS